MNAQEEEFLASLRETFQIEADEHLQAIGAGLFALEKTEAPEQQRSLIESVFRAAHSLKGAARAVNFIEIESICQSLEDTFSAWKRKETRPAPQALDAVHRALDAVTNIFRRAQGTPAPSPSREANTPPPPLPTEPAFAEKAAGQTVRIATAKLDARLLAAEEMLTVKLATNQWAADLREVSAGFSAWTKEWRALQPEVRVLRTALERTAENAASQPELRRVMEFCDWNHDYLKVLENKVAALTRTAEQDRMVIGKLVDELLEDSKKLLMLPFATLGVFFTKIVRDLCRDQGKEADLVIRGEEIEIDKRILEEIKDPLIHILRNCVDHGLELPSERQRLGKQPRATITLAVVPLDGSKVELLVSDNGAGIAVEKVRASAIKLGLLSLEETRRITESEMLDLVFHSDVSTSPIITQLSGRGLGLAIVREKAEKLGGQVFIESGRRAGTTIRIVLPVALATFRGVLIEVAERLFVVPTTNVERVGRFRPVEVQTVEGRETLSFGGRTVGLARLADVLELPVSERRSEPLECMPFIVLGAGDHRVAFAVDAVLDEQEVLVKQLGKPLLRVRNIAGATVLGSGRVAPILNVADLLKSVRKSGGVPRATGKAATADKVAKSILVAEDSITSRMLLKGILESAGYQVKTAVDGLDAFTALCVEHFDLVVSDVEMPRLNGFDLTVRIRADSKLAELPVVLVTALASREDRERGIDAGANAYLVKSNFDQSNLLEAVRRLA